MDFQVDESFAHGKTLAEVIYKLRTGVAELTAKYPEYVHKDYVLSQDGTTVDVGGEHFTLRVTVDTSKVHINGVEDFKSKMAHRKVLGLIKEMFE